LIKKIDEIPEFLTQIEPQKLVLSNKEKSIDETSEVNNFFIYDACW
jgi:hypothetical protein